MESLADNWLSPPIKFSTADLDIKISKQVHDEIAQLMCADAAYRNQNQQAPALKTDQALSNEELDPPIVKQVPQEAN